MCEEVKKGYIGKVRGCMNDWWWRPETHSRVADVFYVLAPSYKNLVCVRSRVHDVREVPLKCVRT